MSFERQYTLPNGVSTSSHKIAVSIIDRYGNEYAPRVLGENPAQATAAQLTFPADNTPVIFPVTFRWEAVAGADCYVWQLARDPQFADIVSSRETTETQISSSSSMNIKEDERYYWRVRTRKANAPDIWSEVRLIANGTGIDKIMPESLDAHIYDGRLLIDADKPSPLTIRIYNLSGQLLSVSEHALQYGENALPLNLRDTDKGIYLLKIQTDTKVITLKMKK
jgi:hypothetical protein